MPPAVRYTDLQAKRAVYWLIAVEFVFALAYIVIHIRLPELTWGPLRPLFNLDGEKSLPTWFSVVQLFAVGQLLFLAAMNNRQKEHLSNFALIVAGLLFVFLSADEGAQLHENLTYVTREVGLSRLSFVGEWGGWIVAYAVLGVLGVALGAKHLNALWRHFRSVAVVGLTGAAMYVVGAVGFEIASFPLRNSEGTSTLHLAAVTVEEFLEMTGVSVILYATLMLVNRLSSCAPESRTQSTR
jgi:hypothetical protein